MGDFEDRQIAKIILDAFDGTFEVFAYYNEDESLSVDVLSCPNRPESNISSYSTIGLWEYPMYQDEEEFPIRIELAGICSSEIEWFPNILSSAAFYIMQTGWLCRPGAVWQDAVTEYAPTSKLKHLYFTAPYIWEDKLKTTTIGGKKVTWLLAIMITEDEYKFLIENGDDAFETLLEEEEINISNVNRVSAI